MSSICDNTQLYLVLPADPRDVKEMLHQCMQAVLGFVQANKLKLNPNEREVLLVNKRTDQEIKISLVLDGAAHSLKERSIVWGCSWTHTHCWICRS